MIGFFDAEFNSQKQSGGKLDCSLLDIAIIPCKSKRSRPTSKAFQSFCKPRMNNGKVYFHIRDLTHIPQQVIDKSEAFPVVYKAFRNYIKQHNITRIFTWGGSDVSMMHWNCDLYSIPREERDILNIFVDIAPEICNKLGAKAVTSIENASYICDCSTRKRHNALDDAKALSEIVYKTDNKLFDRTRALQFHTFEGHRNDFLTAKQLLQSLKVHGTDINDLLERINNGDKFPSFFDYINQKKKQESA